MVRMSAFQAEDTDSSSVTCSIKYASIVQMARMSAFQAEDTDSSSVTCSIIF